MHPNNRMSNASGVTCYPWLGVLLSQAGVGGELYLGLDFLIHNLYYKQILDLLTLILMSK